MAFLVLMKNSSETFNFLSTVPDFMFSLKNIWLVMADFKSLKNLFLPVDSQVFTFKARDDKSIMWEVYNIDVDKEQTVLPFGTWDLESKVLEIDHLPIFERRKDMKGLVLHGETMVEPPFILGNPQDILSGKQEKVGGTFGEVWHGVEKIMNFTTKLVPGSGWGSLNEDGTWNGIINSLHQNKTQIGVAAFFYTQARGTVAAFSPTISEGVDRMFIKYPGREASWTTYIDPFDVSLWFSVLLLLCFLATLLSSTYYLGPEQHHNPGSFTLSNSIVVVLGSQVFQGSWLDPKHASAKITFLVSFVFGVLLYTSYSAKLISFLTVIKTTLPFTTLDGIRGTDFGIGAVAGSAVLDKLIYAPEGTTHRKVAEEIIKQDPANMPPTIEAAIEKAKAGKYAFVWTTEGVYEMNKDNCDLLDIPFTVNSGQLSAAWSKHLPHRHFFDHFIKKMKESGQIDRILIKLNPKPRSDCGYNGEFVSMGLDNMISAFAMAGLGIVVAWVALLVEVAYKGRYWREDKPNFHKTVI